MAIEDVATAVYAGTSVPSGTAALVVDRGDLPQEVRVFVRAADLDLMRIWTEAVKANSVPPAPPLSGGGDAPKSDGRHADPKGGGLEVTLKSPSRLRIRGRGGEELVLDAGPGTHIDVLPGACSAVDGEPKLGFGRVQNREVIFFDGGVPAIELPMRLPPNRYVPIILGISRPQNQRFDKVLHASQRNGEGVLSGGYSLMV